MVADLLSCQENQVAGHAIFRIWPWKLLPLYPLVKAVIKVSLGSVRGTQLYFLMVMAVTQFKEGTRDGRHCYFSLFKGYKDNSLLRSCKDKGS